MCYCILYHHIISKFHSFLDQLPDTFKKINVKGESKAKVILSDGQKNIFQQYMYQIFNGRSIMEPRLINCLLFFSESAKLCALRAFAPTRLARN